MFKIMITSLNEWRKFNKNGADKINEEFPTASETAQETTEETPETGATDETSTDNKSNSGIQNEGRLSDEIASILNAQVKNELMSYQIYMGMTCWLDDKGWIGASKYYFPTAQEELNHMNKIYQYLFGRNVKAVVPVTEEVEQEFSGIRQIVEKSLEHEIQVTKNWEEISQKAKDSGDNTTYEFAQWFLNEQIEEEEKFRNILFKLDLEMPDWKIDELFEELTKA